MSLYSSVSFSHSRLVPSTSSFSLCFTQDCGGSVPRFGAQMNHVTKTFRVEETGAPSINEISFLSKDSLKVDLLYFGCLDT